MPLNARWTSLVSLNSVCRIVCNIFQWVPLDLYALWTVLTNYVWKTYKYFILTSTNGKKSLKITVWLYTLHLYCKQDWWSQLLKKILGIVFVLKWKSSYGPIQNIVSIIPSNILCFSSVAYCKMYRWPQYNSIDFLLNYYKLRSMLIYYWPKTTVEFAHKIFLWDPKYSSIKNVLFQSGILRRFFYHHISLKK